MDTLYDGNVRNVSQFSKKNCVMALEFLVDKTAYFNKIRTKRL